MSVHVLHSYSRQVLYGTDALQSTFLIFDLTDFLTFNFFILSFFIFENIVKVQESCMPILKTDE